MISGKNLKNRAGDTISFFIEDIKTNEIVK